VELSITHKLLAAYLERHCSGADAARPKHRILADLAAMGLRLTGRAFDQAMHDLATATGDAGSGDAGFFWSARREDYDAAYGYMVGRFEPQRERAEAIRRRRDERFPAGGMLFDLAGQSTA
jgi:hypothetical protein